MVKIIKCFNYGNFHIHRSLSVSQIVWKVVYFLPEKCGFAKEASLKFLSQNSNFCCKLKIACYNLSLFILIKLTTIYKTLL